MSLIAIIVSYLIGSISVGYVIAKVSKGIDIREYGSGNIGTTNILRTLGLAPALLVLFLDMFKGFLAVLLANWLVGTTGIAMFSGIAAVLGHNFPIFFSFKGGKGIATSLGVFLGLNPLVFGIITVLGILIILVTRYVSLASIIGAILFPFLLWYFKGDTLLGVREIGLSIVLSVMALVSHRGNIQRLLNGTESKIGQKVDVK